MPKLLHDRALRDAYRFAGFVPASTVRGVFGKPQVRVLTLRRQKKRTAAFVALGKLCRTDPDAFAYRIHVVFAFCLARYNEKFSSGEKDVV